MSDLVFIDLEVNPQEKKVLDFGAIKSNGVKLHTSQKTEFENFIEGFEYICGHNICHHDANYFEVSTNVRYIDTLYVSPLLFPERPYHSLLKDDKIQSDDLSNPLNDAIKTKGLFYDEINALQQLDKTYLQILVNLLYDKPEFNGFFNYIQLKPCWDTIRLISTFFEKKICSNAPLEKMVGYAPIEVAYALAIISTNDKTSIIPHWVHRQFPLIERVLKRLRGTPCGNRCLYCKEFLNPQIYLKRIFGFDSFRRYNGEPLQENAVNAAVNNKSLLAIFPTGGGKSLTFQLPALIAGITERALTVVISPLQSLMKDQVDNLEKKGIVDAVTINGLLNPLERQNAIEKVDTGVASILYISPESLRSKTIEKLLLSRQIARFVIDEAHCFSAWGQDFRVDYLYIGKYIRELTEKKGIKNIPVSCFTATAKQKVVSDIKDYFKDNLGVELELYASNASRTNLRYQVRLVEPETRKYLELRELIKTKDCPTIVYVSRTKQTVKLSDQLKNDGILALPFNGKMDPKAKQSHQDDFINDTVQVMVATSAFGMGVDKANVKLVVHYDISDSLENYVQEAGRAGRDPNLEAECYVLYSDNDLDKHFILNNSTRISCAEINQIWRAIKNMTKNRKSVCSSALEIARTAGWNYEVIDIETRVKTALQALENAGFIQRGKNSPHVYATSILAKNYEEAASKIDASKLFLSIEEKTRAKRVIKSLISCKHITRDDAEAAESRVDYLADILGMTKNEVVDVVQIMRQEKILKDDRDISAFIESTRKSLEVLTAFQKLIMFILDKLTDDGVLLNLKLLNEEAEKLSIKTNVKNIKTILLFWKSKSYVRLNQENQDLVEVIPQMTIDELKNKQIKILSVSSYIVEFLSQRYESSQKKEPLILFSIIELLENYNNDNGLFVEYHAEVHDIEEALLFLAKINSVKLEGGFLVLYMGLNINRIKENGRLQYTKEDYRKLDEFYRHKIEQIHIVGEFANMMVRDYNAAITFVNDYFFMDYKRFLSKYFTQERLVQIERNITPKKYDKLFKSLSPLQKEIIDDDLSPHIVISAGPGSGKTRVLVHKLASLLLLEDIKCEQLLMLTFSRAAAIEFKARLRNLLENDISFLEIKTFHSYCFDLIGRMGKIEDVKDVIPQATKMILDKEVEPNRIIKKVLVIDEAQDMTEEEFHLVEALMESNDNLRVIAVGDDDQNIYQFRGSSSDYFQRLITKYNAKSYELLENYRSSEQIVTFANKFVTSIQNRMKSEPIVSKQQTDGEVVLIKHSCRGGFETAVINDLKTNYKDDTCAVLTSTNHEALIILGILKRNGIKCKLIQSNDGFNLSDIAELRFFTEMIRQNIVSPKISKEVWEDAKRALNEQYSQSACLSLINDIVNTFDSNYEEKYMSDFTLFLNESSIDDFIKTEKSTVMVSTIHKAKGREFDQVYMYLNCPSISTDEEKRKLYVGFTRAKRYLNIHYNTTALDNLQSVATEFRIDNTQYDSLEQIVVPLTHKDVNLAFFKDKKAQITRLRSGMSLDISADYLLKDNHKVLKFSKAFSENLIEYQKMGYAPSKAKIRFVVWWYCKDDDMEYAIFLPALYLRKSEK